MDDFLSYSPEDVIAANLCECDARLDMICEQEAAHLRELASELAIGGSLNPDFFASLRDHRPAKAPLAADTLSQNKHLLGAHRTMLAAWQSVTLCRELHRLLAKERLLRPEDFFGEIEELPDTALGRVVYQRNGYADAAYLRFAERITSPHVLYAHSFSAVCDQIYNRNCEFGILPVESSAEGPLNSVLGLIDRYELTVAATLDVPTNDASRTTRFALLRRDPLPLFGENEKDLRFEFSVAGNAEPSVAELLFAADFCGLTLLRSDTRTLPQDKNAVTTRFVLGSENGDLYTYLLYLAMEASHYTPIGIYLHLERPEPKRDRR